MRLIKLLPVLFLYLLGLVYLSLPQPAVPVVIDGLRSQETGDTDQNPDQSAYFTQKERQQVLSEIQSDYALSFQGITLPSFRLNYRPEESQTLVREQIQSYYLEEVIHPMREALFINGWEPENSPIYASIPQEKKPRIQINGQFYLSKVTIRPVFSSLWARLFVWTLIFPASYLVFLSIKKTYNLLYE